MWIQHQQSPPHLICVEGAAARIYAWEDWSEAAWVPLTTDLTGLQLESVIPYLSDYRRQILLELSELDGSPDTRSLHLLDAAPFSIESFCSNEAVSEAVKGRNDSDNVSITKENAAAVSIPLLGSQLAALAQRVAHVVASVTPTSSSSSTVTLGSARQILRASATTEYRTLGNFSYHMTGSPGKGTYYVWSQSEMCWLHAMMALP